MCVSLTLNQKHFKIEYLLQYILPSLIDISWEFGMKKKYWKYQNDQMPHSHMRQTHRNQSNYSLRNTQLFRK